MKNIICFLFLFYSSLFSAGTYDGVDFTDYEEQGSLYFCNYYDKQDFINIGISSTDTNTIINARNNSLFTSLTDVASLSGIVNTDMYAIRQKSHLIDWNIYTDDFGMTLHQTNFIYALTGVLIGFVFFLGFTLVIVNGGF